MPVVLCSPQVVLVAVRTYNPERASSCDAPQNPRLGCLRPERRLHYVYLERYRQTMGEEKRKAAARVAAGRRRAHGSAWFVRAQPDLRQS